MHQHRRLRTYGNHNRIWLILSSLSSLSSSLLPPLPLLFLSSLRGSSSFCSYGGLLRLLFLLALLLLLNFSSLRLLLLLLNSSSLVRLSLLLDFGALLGLLLSYRCFGGFLECDLLLSALSGSCSMLVGRKDGLDLLCVEAFEFVGGDSGAEGLLLAGNLWCVR